jgi:hypothetical protein
MRRGVLLHSFVIVAPALILLYLGLQSVQRQHQAIGALAESNRILAAEKLATCPVARRAADVDLSDRQQEGLCRSIAGRSSPVWAAPQP